MNKLESYLVYQPPKSNSHGHWVRGKNIGQGLQRTAQALVNNLNMHQVGELDIRLPRDSSRENDTSWQNTRDLFIKHFGEPSHSQQPFFDGIKDILMWKAAMDLFDFLKMYEQAKVEEMIPLNQLWLHAAYTNGDANIPRGTFSCFIIPSRLLVSLRLIFPYTIDDQQLYILIKKIQTDLPFKLNAKHFRRLGPSKNGHSTWKLDKDTQDRVEACLGAS